MPVHGDNLRTKLGSSSEYSDAKGQQFLAEILPKYEAWLGANEELGGPFTERSSNDAATIKKRVQLFEEYKAFLDQKQYAEHFDSRSNLQSSVLEEFFEYLFRDLVTSFVGNPLMGKSHAFKDIFFAPRCYSEMIIEPAAKIETKDHDFIIGVRMYARLSCSREASEPAQDLEWDLPAVAIECKTYLDKAMLESSSMSAEQLKARNPNGLYIVVMEYIKLAEDVNLRKYKVDQMYVLRCQKNIDRKYRVNLDPVSRTDTCSGWHQNPINADAVIHLYETVRSHLSQDWEGTGMSGRIERGYLL